MNNKGQALVEFVIILPIFIFMLLVIIDIGKILYNQNILESEMEDIVTLYKKNNQEELDEFIKAKNEQLTIETNEEYVELKIMKDMEILTPGLNLILGNPHQITSKRVIYNE